MGVFSPATDLVGGGFGKLLQYVWILLPIVAICSVGAIVWWVKKIKAKKAQWTHTLKVKRVMQDNRVSEPFIIHMRRFPIIKKAEVFELEKPLLGGYLLPELDEYSGANEFSIILDKNNRIYTNKGEFFDPDKSCINISAKHSEIDIQRQNLKSAFQNINKVSKRIEWATIAKYAFMIMGIICFTIVALAGVQNWSKAQDAKAIQAQSEAQAMMHLGEALKVIEATVNTQKLEILPMLQDLYKTKNIQPYINIEVNKSVSS